MKIENLVVFGRIIILLLYVRLVIINFCVAIIRKHIQHHSFSTIWFWPDISSDICKIWFRSDSKKMLSGASLMQRIVANWHLCMTVEIYVSFLGVWSLSRCRRCLPSSWCSCMVWQPRRLLSSLTNIALQQRKLICLMTSIQILRSYLYSLNLSLNSFRGMSFICTCTL